MMNFGSKAELYRDTKNVSARRPRVRVFLFSLAFFVYDWGFDWVALVVCGFILATHLLLARVITFIPTTMLQWRLKVRPVPGAHN